MKLTKEHKEVMSVVKFGGDIFSYKTARLLREVKKLHPSWLEITKPEGTYSAIEQNPYFGAILTSKGLGFLAGKKSRKKK